MSLSVSEKEVTKVLESYPKETGSCRSACPFGAIEIRGRTSASCGKAFATEDEYGWALKKAASSDTDGESPLCDTYRRKKSANVLAAAFGERSG